MDGRDLELLKVAQDGVLFTERPYQILGEMVGMSEQEVVDRLRALQDEGIIRRFAATIGHRALGIVANAMIAWKAPPDEVQRAGQILGSDDEVTHCYEVVIYHCRGGLGELSQELYHHKQTYKQLSMVRQRNQ